MRLTKRAYMLAGGAVLLVAAIAVAAATLPGRVDPITVPENTSLRVTLDQSISSDQNRSGDRFEATVSEPVVIDGKTVIPEGARATGLVVDVKHSGRLMGRARLHLSLESIQVDGKSYDVRTTSPARVGKDHKKRNWALIGGGAGGGALIGAAAGGGEGALIGAPIGAGAGVATAFFTGKRDIRLPAETHLRFTLAEPVTIDSKH
jgi:hypothetical protein